jgi:hypothetical protein
MDDLLAGRRQPADPAEARAAAAVAALRGWPAPRLRPELRVALRARLLSPQDVDGPVVSVPAPRRTTARTAPATTTAPTAVAAPLRRRVARMARPAFVGAIATTVVAAGVSVGAERALPGQPLYTIKRHVEQLQVGLTADTVERAKVHLALARIRLAEIRTVVSHASTTYPPDAGVVNGLLADWRSEASAGSGVLLARARSGSRDAWTTMDNFTNDQSTRLTELMAVLPAGSVPQVTEALGFISEIGDELDTTGPNTSSPAPTGVDATASPTPTSAPSTTAPTPSTPPVLKPYVAPTAPAGGPVASPSVTAAADPSPGPASPTAPVARPAPTATAIPQTDVASGGPAQTAWTEATTGTGAAGTAATTGP